MKKSIIVALLLQAACAYPLTPPATPGENVWDLVARIGQELDEEIETGISFTDVVESKVDEVDRTLEGIASCCDNTNSVVIPEIQTNLSVADSLLDSVSSVLVEIATSDLPRIESKVDHLATDVNLSLLDEFSGTWTLLHAVDAQVSAVESIVDEVATEVQEATSLVEVINGSDLPAISSLVDAAIATAQYAASVCEDIKNNTLPTVESKIDAIDSITDLTSSVVEVIAQTDLPRIESKIDAIDEEVSVIDGAATSIESTMEYINSKVDLLGSAGGATCDGTPIFQADLTPSFTLSAPGYYCLAEDVTGRIIITGTDITLDLNNHTITGAGVPAAAGFGSVIQVRPTAARVVIRNGRVVYSATVDGTGCVSVQGSTNVVCEDLQLSAVDGGTAPFVYGIIVSTGAVVGVVTTHTVIRRCTARTVGAASRGFILNAGAVNTQILDCTSIGGNVGIRSTGVSAISDFIIQNCFVSGATGAGISVSTNITNMQIIDTTVTGSGLRGIDLSAAGGANLINAAVIKGCRINGNVADGIRIQNGQQITISDNVITANTTTGILCSGVNNTHIAHNSIRSNLARGMLLTTCNGGVIEYNTVENNPTSGIQLSTNVTNFSIENNDLVNNGAINLSFAFPTDANTIVANKAHTSVANNGTGSNYSSQIAIPVIQWDRSANAVTFVSGTGAVTGWHNWSSVA